MYDARLQLHTDEERAQGVEFRRFQRLDVDRADAALKANEDKDRAARARAE